MLIPVTFPPNVPKVAVSTFCVNVLCSPDGIFQVSSKLLLSPAHASTISFQPTMLGSSSGLLILSIETLTSSFVTPCASTFIFTQEDAGSSSNVTSVHTVCAIGLFINGQTIA